MTNKNPEGTEQPFIFVLKIPFFFFFVYMTTPEFEAIRWGSRELAYGTKEGSMGSSQATSPPPLYRQGQ